ncbi:PLP-dependent transferase [Microthyrium microscopicum]|uniref:PLP-dependent transferase n=1 Tax=Microthyrium microscopicum TaxID=703497 RepID=A0A6A6UKK9_9PEZI|nr:PLP-dependent transferase [Microthyrium microscopicum]
MSSPRLINLLRGWPAPSLLPSKLLLRAATSVLQEPEVFVPALQYAPNKGPTELRNALSTFLTKTFSPHSPVPIDRISTTGGASQSLGIILNTCADPGYTRAVWVVEPTYFLACRIIDDAGLKAKSVEDGVDGIDFADFRRQLREVEDEAVREGKTGPVYKPMPRAWPAKLYKHIIYCVPSFSNPTGRCMSLKTRVELVRLAREFDALIVCDDVYDVLWWPAQGEVPKKGAIRAVIPRIVDVDRVLDGGAERKGADGFGNALSNGSFSKICGPGVRTGWVEATSKLAFALSQAGPIRSGGASSNLTGVFVARSLENGDLQKHITEVLIPDYAKRWKTMVQAIEEHLEPLGVQLPWKSISVASVNDRSSTDAEVQKLAEQTFGDKSVPDVVAGGYFIYALLPKGISATDLAEQAMKENVIIQTEALCRVPIPKSGGKEPNKAKDRFIRLCFAWEDEDMLSESIERLGKALKRMIEDPSSHSSGERSSSINQNQYS